MRYKAEIDIMPINEVLDPQGKTISCNMKNIGLPEIENVRIGRHITLELEALSEYIATAKVDDACVNFFANPIIENYQFIISEIN